MKLKGEFTNYGQQIWRTPARRDLSAAARRLRKRENKDIAAEVDLDRRQVALWR